MKREGERTLCDKKTNDHRYKNRTLYINQKKNQKKPKKNEMKQNKTKKNKNKKKGGGWLPESRRSIR